MWFNIFKRLRKSFNGCALHFETFREEIVYLFGTICSCGPWINTQMLNSSTVYKKEVFLFSYKLCVCAKKRHENA